MFLARSVRKKTKKTISYNCRRLKVRHGEMVFLKCPSAYLHYIALCSIKFLQAQGNSFALNKLLLWLFSIHNSYSLPSSLLFWYSLIYFLQWMATRGLRWSPCTPHWSSALHAHRLRWAQPWRRPWGPLKTLCSHPSPKSRTESPDQARSQPGIFLFSFFWSSF